MCYIMKGSKSCQEVTNYPTRLYSLRNERKSFVLVDHLFRQKFIYEMNEYWIGFLTNKSNQSAFWESIQPKRH
jgi:hypothetical protein